MLLYFNPQNIK